MESKSRTYKVAARNDYVFVRFRSGQEPKESPQRSIVTSKRWSFDTLQSDESCRLESALSNCAFKVVDVLSMMRLAT